MRLTDFEWSVSNLIEYILPDLYQLHLVCIFSYSTSLVVAFAKEICQKHGPHRVDDFPEELSWRYVALIVVWEVLLELWKGPDRVLVCLGQSNVHVLGHLDVCHLLGLEYQSLQLHIPISALRGSLS